MFMVEIFCRTLEKFLRFIFHLAEFKTFISFSELSIELLCTVNPRKGGLQAINSETKRYNYKNEMNVNGVSLSNLLVLFYLSFKKNNLVQTSTHKCNNS